MINDTLLIVIAVSTLYSLYMQRVLFIYELEKRARRKANVDKQGLKESLYALRNKGN